MTRSEIIKALEDGKIIQFRLNDGYYTNLYKLMNRQLFLQPYESRSWEPVSWDDLLNQPPCSLSIYEPEPEKSDYTPLRENCAPLILDWLGELNVEASCLSMILGRIDKRFEQVFEMIKELKK